MEYLKTRDQVNDSKLGSIHESVFKIGDVYKVKTTIEIPKSLINGFVSKAKKEHNIDPRENWSDIDLAEMFVNYVTANFLTVESLPVQELLGDKQANPDETTIQPAEAQAATTPTDEPAQTQPAQGATVDTAQTPTGEIQTQNPIQ